jgi:hypothetical protein
MPANLPPQYFDAEKRYRLARTSQEKILALEEMLRIMPKHKGTDRLQGDLKRKISKLRAESVSHSRGGRRTDMYVVEKAGAGQIALAGPPNAGKSMLMAALTNAAPEVADYPFTTRMPQTGILHFENVRIQLVDLPAIHSGWTEAWVFAILRNADALWIVLDLNNDDVLNHAEWVLAQLVEASIRPLGNMEKTGHQEEEDRTLPKRTLLAGNKWDLDHAEDHFQLLHELYGERFPIVPVSALGGSGLRELGKATFDLLGILRAYTKTPGKEPDLKEPVILPVGSTVLDFAEQIHKDFALKLKFARIWGSDKHAGQRVHRDYPLTDGDILELHI